MTNTAPLDLDYWKTALNRYADGLNLDDAEDRAAFRTRVGDGTARTRVAVLRQLAFALGDKMPAASRASVTRNLADLWMCLPEHARVPSSAAATDEQRREQAKLIERLAHALANGTLIGPRHAAVARLVEAAELLRAWTPDDREASA